MFGIIHEYRIVDYGERKPIAETINTDDLVCLIKYAKDKFMKEYDSVFVQAPLMLAFNTVMLIIQGLGLGKSRQQIKELIDKE